LARRQPRITVRGCLMPQSAAVRAAHEDDLPPLRQEGNPRPHDFNSATLATPPTGPAVLADISTQLMRCRWPRDGTEPLLWQPLITRDRGSNRSVFQF
jgi:hypothetical protein